MADLVPVDYNPFADGAGVPATFVPVDHDPFAGRGGTAATAVPVDYDPFATGAGTPATLVPVDHNPFADGLGTSASLSPTDQDHLAAVGDAANSSVLGPNQDLDPTSSAVSNSLSFASPLRSQSSAPFLAASYDSSARPWWGPPAAPTSVWDPWYDHAIKGIQGIFDFINRRRQLTGDPNAPGCKEEWEAARSDCAGWLSMPNPPRGLSGGYTNIEDCARGLVSERCGGNRYERDPRKK